MDSRRPQRGCWTCKARKVQCDRTLPSCQRCIQSSRQCEGYEDRLSWPRNNDSKRTLTAPISQTPVLGGLGKYHFVNSAPRHVELHQNVSSQCISSGEIRPTQSIIRLSTRQDTGDSELTWDELVEYFQSTAYQSLITFNTPSTAIRDVLMRIIYAGNSEAENGVYLALLAFASLHKRLYQQANYLKVFALQALSTSSLQFTQTKPELWEALCHVAACMLLCSFETLVPSISSGEWLWYVLGAMSMVHSVAPEEDSNQAEVGVLLDWFYYHYALSRFASRHWNHKTVVPLPDGNPTAEHEQINQPSNTTSQNTLPTHTILSLLAEACDTLSLPNGHNLDDYYQKLDELRSRTVLLPLQWTPGGAGQLVFSNTAEVYQAAVLIYLKHASQGPWEVSSSSSWHHTESIDALVDAIFESHIEISSECTHLFPLLMIACEARTEERRAAIIKCMERTDANSEQQRNFDRIKAEIKCMWTQQDLYADLELREDTQRLLSAVVSSNSALPSYA